MSAAPYWLFPHVIVDIVKQYFPREAICMLFKLILKQMHFTSNYQLEFETDALVLLAIKCHTM